MHGNRIYSPNAKFFSSVMKQSKYFDEETLEKVTNKCVTPREFNNAVIELNTKRQNLYMLLDISSLSYNHLELYNFVKIKQKIIEIFESRLQKTSSA